jgi:hypothetical protein
MSEQGAAAPVPFGDFPDWYRPLFQVSEPEVAFDLATLHLRRKRLLGSPRRIHMALAEAWFEIAAAAAGSPDMYWRITEEQNENGYATKARAWMRRAIRAEYPPQANGGIQVDPSTFAIRLDGDGFLLGQDFSAQVVSADPQRAITALAAASQRFMYVTGDGRESTPDDPAGGDWRNYTPNYVSDPQEHPDGPTIECDCKDGVMPLMARTMIRILVEELRTAGVDHAQIRPRAD